MQWKKKEWAIETIYSKHGWILKIQLSEENWRKVMHIMTTFISRKANLIYSNIKQITGCLGIVGVIWQQRSIKICREGSISIPWLWC